MVCMHVGCYSATLRWDRFGRWWAEPPSGRPPPFTSPNIHPLSVLHPFARLLCTPAKYPQFVSNSLVISLSLSHSPPPPPSLSFFFVSLSLSFFLLVPPARYPPPTLNIAARHVAFLLAKWKSRFLVTLTYGISDLPSTYRQNFRLPRVLIMQFEFLRRAASRRFV